jgi:hypothetical protein
VGVSLPERLPVVRHVHLAPEERLQAVLAGLPVQLHGARERAVVRERHRRHPELGRPRAEVGDSARPVEDRVLGVDVQVDERRLGHRESDSRAAVR